MLQCGLLGEKLGHSYSPAIHAMLGDYSYRLFERTPQEVEQFLRGGEFHALNVTIPYKKTALRCCDALSPLAAEIGAVNTVVRRADGTLFGDNTDAYGLQWLLSRAGMDVAGSKVLVLGSGGASAMAQVLLRRLGAEVVVLSRTGEERYAGAAARHPDAAFVLNATPVGMYPKNGETPLPLAGFSALRGVVDLIYNPAKTALMLEAERMGVPAAGGLSMLVAQAKRASELFTGSRIPDSRMEEILKTLSADMQNILLIGMPGSGKTTVGTALAEKLGRSFVDSDEEILRMTGETPAALISRLGEEAFRAVETEALRGICRESGRVIATGGGCVTRAENFDILHQNSRVVLLTRPLSLLETEGRPLSASAGVEQLWQQRKALYHSFCDFAVENSGTPQQTIQQILEGIS